MRLPLTVAAAWATSLATTPELSTADYAAALRLAQAANAAIKRPGKTTSAAPLATGMP